MKWFLNLGLPFKSKALETSIKQDSIDLEKGTQLFLSNQFDEALFHLDNALNKGFNSGLYQLRAKCFQKLNFHYKAIEDFDKVIEDNPLEFSNYYSRAISKNAISDISGQVEDLQSCIYYYKKHKNIENSILKNLETELITTRKYVESVKSTIASLHNISYSEIKNLINESLLQIKKIRPRTRRLKTTKNSKILLGS